MDVSLLHNRDLPFKPPSTRLKPAFDSQKKKSENKEMVLQKHFKFDLDQIFEESGKKGEECCYKTFSKFDMSYDRDETI